MRAADKVTVVDTSNGASLLTFATADALFVVYRCDIINNFDSLYGANLLALAATDTAV